ncbi:MAG: phosphatase PAP2 family protein [Alphaproteobacteria bacterium]|nr:phosphatase PAP2 family protein [Alphaproteobacteria bacterium]
MRPNGLLRDGHPVPSDHRSAITWTCVAFIVATTFFLSYPQVDLIVSGWFFGPDGFVRGGETTAQAIRDVFKLSYTFLCAAIIIAAIVREVAKIRLFRLSRAEVWYLIVSLTTGPGILVNSVFKDQWGRARPVTVEEFGGSLDFSPVWMIAGQCDRNCSFMSGEAAAGFSLIAVALIASRYRALVFAFAIGVGITMGLVRIVMGGHFLSDTIFAALTVTLVSLIAHHVIVGGHNKGIMKWVGPVVRALSGLWNRMIDAIEQQARRR